MFSEKDNSIRIYHFAIVLPRIASCARIDCFTEVPDVHFVQNDTRAVGCFCRPAGAKDYFINLKDGDTVSSPFLVQFGLSGMGVAPAGVEKPNTGHHHLLIDAAPLTEEQMKEPLPVDDSHKHFGGGQTETMVTLPEGKHTLQLLLGDWTHIPHVPPVMSEPITITVR